MSKATELLFELIIYPASIRKPVGGWIAALRPDQREILETLKSDDAARMRPFWK